MNRYYEAHITVAPNNDPFSWFARHMENCGWKASMFEEDEVDNIAGKWFASFRHENSDTIIAEVKGMVAGLGEVAGLKVERWKIEWTLFDSKLGHELENMQ